MPPVMNRAPMMNRPMLNRPQVPMNRPMTPMNRVSSAPAATQGIGQALAAQAAAQQSGMSPMGGAGGNMPQGIAALLAGIAAKNPQPGVPQTTSQMRPIEGDDYMADLMRSAQTMGGQMGLGQTMGSPLQTGQLGSSPVMMPATSGGPLGSSPLGAVFDPSLSNNPMQTATPMGPMANSPFGLTPQFPMGGLPYDSTITTTQQDMMGGNRQAPQTNMASNLAQMFNQLGGQQPAQQGGTPLQNGASPLQQSAKPVMNMGVM